MFEYFKNMLCLDEDYEDNEIGSLFVTAAISETNSFELDNTLLCILNMEGTDSLSWYVPTKTKETTNTSIRVVGPSQDLNQLLPY
jgi:hypothetical protein